MNGLYVVSLKIHRKSRSAGESSVTSYENTPGAGAEPGLLRSHLRDAAVLCTGTKQRQRRPSQRRRRTVAPGTNGLPRWQLLHSPSREKHGCRPISSAKRHLTRPLKPITKTQHDKSCSK